MRNLLIRLLAIAVCGSPALAQARPELEKPDPNLPDDYHQLVPRGDIPAIDTPEFVGAGEAEIDDEAWVLGVVIAGQAKAYSLNLLNRHEVVNDRFGDTPVAAVW